MTTIVGAVYCWEEHLLISSWKKSFLSLNEKTGQLLWVNKSGEILGGADLKQVFLLINLRQFQIDDHRLKKEDLKFAPYYLVIPMASVGVSKKENKEFALGSLDELETWMKKFAECVGALERFKQVETTQNTQFTKPVQKPAWTEGPSPQIIITQPPTSNIFNSFNRHDYMPHYYSTLWAQFLAEEETSHLFNYGPSGIGKQARIVTSYPVIHFATCDGHCPTLKYSTLRFFT